MFIKHLEEITYWKEEGNLGNGGGRKEERSPTDE